MKCPYVLLLSVLAALLLSVAPSHAQDKTFLAMRPDTVFCIPVVFGGSGRGEYTLTVEDTGFPPGGWADTHRSSFVSGPDNPVTTPVCFSTKNRRVGEQAAVTFRVETPQGEEATQYGICVSNYEDSDVIESDENPCEATVSHTDVFTLALAESEKYAAPGQTVRFTVLVSSEFDAAVTLAKESGPAMTIGQTTLEMPGDHTVELSVAAPQSAGDSTFVIRASAANCTLESCVKRVSGVIHVGQATPALPFTIELSPPGKNVAGTEPAKFFITVHNFQESQTFSITVDLDSSALVSDFTPIQLRVNRDQSSMIDFTVVAQSASQRVYSIVAGAADAAGIRKTSQAVLTVQEPVSDAQRRAESDPGLKPAADAFEERYEASPSLDDWESVSTEPSSGTGPAPGPAPVNWLLIAGAAAGAFLIIFYIYRRTRVYGELQEMPER